MHGLVRAVLEQVVRYAQAPLAEWGLRALVVMEAQLREAEEGLSGAAVGDSGGEGRHRCCRSKRAARLRGAPRAAVGGGWPSRPLLSRVREEVRAVLRVAMKVQLVRAVEVREKVVRGQSLSAAEGRDLAVLVQEELLVEVDQTTAALAQAAEELAVRWSTKMEALRVVAGVLALMALLEARVP